MVLPIVFIPHGGGPWPFVAMGLDQRDVEKLSAYLREVAATPAVKPRALLVVSAHWEEDVPTVMTAKAPAMLYDYVGFPPEAYTLTWPAPGEPTVAARVRELLSKAGVRSAEDAQRGFDHGTFVPLKLAYPNADIPVVQLSLKRGLDPLEHMHIGRALAPLRNEGVFIVASGMSFHNLHLFHDPRSRAIADDFDAWLRATVTLPSNERDAGLAAWERAPSARLAHPREEHLAPLFVAVGAAGADRGVVSFNDTFMGLRLSGYAFSSQS